MALTTIDDRGLKTPIDLLDNEKIRFGTGNDLELYHDGSNSRIANTTGQLSIAGGVVAITNAAVSENLAKFTADGAVELYYDNVKKLDTASGGINVVGYVNVQSSGQIYIEDGGKLNVGTSNDLKIYHSNSASANFIETGSQIIHIQSDSSIRLQKNTGSENMLIASADGAVELYYDNVKTFNTVANGIEVRGTEGVEGHIYLYADEGDDVADWWLLKADHVASGFYIQNKASGSWEDNIRCFGNGAVELFHDNLKRFETISTGAAVYGDAGTEARLRVIGQEGRSAELQLWADDGDDYTDICRIHQSTNGNLYIQNNTAQSAWENFIVGTPNSSVTLYYDNDPKAWTYVSGFQIKTAARIQGVAGGNATLLMYADDAGQNADYWKLDSEHVGNGFTIASYAGASWQTVFKGTDARTAELHYQGSKKQGRQKKR